MRFAVAVKQVPDTMEMSVDENGSLVRAGVPSILNPYDECALSRVLELRREGDEVVVFTMGPPQARQALERCLEMGADRAYLLTDRDFAGADVWATARALTAFIIKFVPDADLYVFGRQAIDGDTGQVPFEVAAQLGVQQFAYVESLSVSHDGFTAVQDYGDVRRTCSVPRGSVVSFGTVDPNGTLDRARPVLGRAEGVHDQDRLHDRFLQRQAQQEGGDHGPCKGGQVHHRRTGGGQMSECSGGSCSTCSSCGSDDPDRLPPGMLKVYNLNQSTADGILVWIETEPDGDGVRMADVSAELLGAARKLSDGRVFAVVFGGTEVKPLYPRIFGCGVDSLYHVRERELEVYRPEAYASCIVSLIKRIEPATVLIGATTRGRELAPRIASELGTGLTADCTGLRAEGRKIVMTRPAFGGNLIADIECLRFPQMATVRQGTFPMPEEREGTGTAIYWQFGDGMGKDIVSEERVVDSGRDIRDARVLISLGDGIRDRSLIDVAESVAAKVGGMVSCSRSLVEKGWMPRSRQVGMSGRTVAPDLYIAFGISGVVQHRVGMSGAGKVIAVNSDPDAPIHHYADLSLIADAGEILREMDRAL